MGSDMMDVEQLAAYLRRDAREVGKLASRGRLPGHKVGGEWRFAARKSITGSNRRCTATPTRS